MAKKAIFKMAAGAISNLKFSIFGHVTVIGFNDVVYQISSKSVNFSLRYSYLTIFKMAAVRHLGFYIIAFFVP